LPPRLGPLPPIALKVFSNERKDDSTPMACSITPTKKNMGGLNTNSVYLAI
jgi:hypothetical protein